MIDRAAQVDSLIDDLWPRLGDVALAAVGGYGRRELFPYSDIDLLIVSDRDDLRDYLAPFIRALWDSGLRVGQSVHTVEELLDLDDRNVELSVSLLDRRFLEGDRALYDKIRDPGRERIAPALAKLTRERHAKFGNTIYHLEPNVKDTPGALRDLQVLRWLAHLDSAQACLPPHELLFRIRTELHLAASRDQNVLSYQMQDECPAKLAFPGPADLMRAYYREAAPIYRACVRAIEAGESRRSPLFRSFLDRSARYSNAAFSIVRGQVFFRVPPVDGQLLSAVFEFVSRHGLRLAPDTEERIEKLVAGAVSSPISWQDLKAVLEQPHAPLAVRAMLDTGYLAAIFPAMKGIESLVVRDFYHRYTVDEHTLVAIETACQLRSDTGQFGDIARETPDYPVLLAALLFHDTGKGVPGDSHSEASVAIATQAFREIGVPSHESDTALFLIRHHLEMSRLMTGRDLSDPATAAALANIVGTVERLKMLTMLTYCDISAVNPAALTPWRTTLLWQLYTATARHLTQELTVDSGVQDMPARYLLTHSADEIERHRAMETTGRIAELDRVGSAHRITVVAPDRPFLFASVAGALAGFGMNILRAEAFSNHRHFAIEIFTFSDPLRALELNPSEYDRLKSVVSDAATGRKKAEDLLRGRPAPKRAGSPPRVSFDNTASPRATLFEITAPDRPGLLFDLSAVISKAGCNIEVVLIDTEGQRAIDVFYVTRDGKPLDEVFASELTGALRHIGSRHIP